MAIITSDSGVPLVEALSIIHSLYENSMPLIQVTMLEGRSPEAKAALILRLTEGVVDAVGAPRESVRVILQEVPPAHWGVGGVSKANSTKEVKNG